MIACLLVATLAVAAPAQKSRTLAEVVELAMREGQEFPLNAAMADEFGLGEREYPGRRLRYKQSVSPDRQEHSLTVLYEDRGKGQRVPTAILVNVGTATKDGDILNIDGHVYLASLKGHLQRASRNSGPMGNVRASKVKVNSALRKRFKVELDFFRKIVPSLGLEFIR